MGCTACTEPKCLYKGDLYLYLFTFYCRESFRDIRQTYRNMVKERSVTLNVDAVCFSEVLALA